MSSFCAAFGFGDSDVFVRRSPIAWCNITRMLALHSPPNFARLKVCCCAIVLLACGNDTHMPSEPFVRFSEGGDMANTSTTDTFRSDANTFGNLGGRGPAISNYPSDETALANIDNEGRLDANGENGGAQNDTVGNTEQVAGTSAALEQSVDTEETNEPPVGPERRRNSSDSSSPDPEREFDEDVMTGDTHSDDDAPASPACEPWGPTCADLEDARGGGSLNIPHRTRSWVYGLGSSPLGRLLLPNP